MTKRELKIGDSQIVLYQSNDGTIKIDVRLEDETVWLSQEQMGALFGKGRSIITEHIGNIFKEGELEESVVCREFRHTTQHGAIAGKTQEKNIKFYNLDVIISVGYRVKSQQGTQFHIWATQRLREYIIKGFTFAEKWYISIVDVVEVLTESPNPRKYWSVLKTRMKAEGSELATNCSQLKMQSADGKYYKTDVADVEQLFRLVPFVECKETTKK